MSKVFFTGCTHFGSEIAFKYTWSRHRFKNVAAVDKEIIRNWNKTVAPEDTVYHLGDFAHKDMSLKEQIKYRKKLNGRIVLIRGNHDVFDEIDYNTYLVDQFYNVPQIICENETSFKLCHYPVQRDLNHYTLTSHIHEKWRVARRMLNVGVDANNFTPLSIEDVLFCVNAEKNKHWDANVYPDAPIDWRWEVTHAGRDVPGEPTKEIIYTEKQNNL